MTQLRWSMLLLFFFIPAATDLLFFQVSVSWIVGCTGVALLWDLFANWGMIDIGMCLIPGMLLFVLSRVSNGIGTGDVLCAFLIGSVCGVRIGLEILFGGSVFCFFGQISCMAVRAAKQKRQRKGMRLCVAEEKVEKMQIQSEMPFVPWLLASVFINWILQVISI